ncbi:MAG: hypothetical protein D6806_15535 [Deltaproteobacteria bacterium]|nr:MAG: hypothetical protein D6806_15535 [Deltaproteobacteria bacterium]
MTFAALRNDVTDGPVTIRKLRGITDEEFAAALSAADKLIDGGCNEEAVDVLSGLALYDPFCPEVWTRIERFCRLHGDLEAAGLFASLARSLAA